MKVDYEKSVVGIAFMHIIVSVMKVDFDLKSAHMLMLSKMFFRKTKYYNSTYSQFTSTLIMGCKRKETTRKIETTKQENSAW